MIAWKCAGRRGRVRGGEGGRAGWDVGPARYAELIKWMDGECADLRARGLSGALLRALSAQGGVDCKVLRAGARLCHPSSARSCFEQSMGMGMGLGMGNEHEHEREYEHGHEHCSMGDEHEHWCEREHVFLAWARARARA